MPEREYEADLGPNDRLRIRIVTDRGQVLDFLVQHETLVGESYRAVVRYDCSHGFAHLDRLNRRGDVVEKVPFPSTMELKQCLVEAEQDVRSNWRQYKRWFLETN